MHIKAEIHYLEGISDLQSQITIRQENELKESSDANLTDFESNAKQKFLQLKQKTKSLQKNFRTLLLSNQNLEHEILVLKSDIMNYKKLKKTISAVP